MLPRGYGPGFIYILISSQTNYKKFDEGPGR